MNNSLNPTKIYLSVSKLVKLKLYFFKSRKKQIDFDSHLKLNWKRLHPIDSVKYFEIIIDKNLVWRHQINNVNVKLNRANALLSKIRHFVNVLTLLNQFVMLILNFFEVIRY